MTQMLLDANGLPLLLGNGAPIIAVIPQYPTDNLVAHWVASQGTTLDGSNVTDWADQVGSLNLEPIVNPATTGFAPSGDDAIQIADDQSLREIGTGSLPTGASASTIVLCWRPTPGTGAFGGIAWGTNTAGQSRGIVANDLDQITGDWIGVGNKIYGPYADGSDFISILTYDGATLALYDDTTLQDSASVTLATASTQVNLMCSYSNNTTQGKIYEILIYSDVLNAEERQQVVNYMTLKYFNDSAPPVIVESTPADNATDISPYLPITITFNKAIAFDSGSIILRENSGGGFANLYTFDVATEQGTIAGKVNISDSTLTIYPDDDLTNSRSYAIQIPSTAIKDLNNNYFAGIANDTTLNWTTEAADVAAPTISSTVPSDNATGISTTAYPTITFDEPVAFGTGNITLRTNDGGWADVQAFNVATETGGGVGKVEIVGNTLTIRPTSALANSREYAIRIDATAIDDLAGNSFAGIADDTTFSFTTVAASTATILYWDDVGDDGTRTPWTASNTITVGNQTISNAHFTGGVIQALGANNLTFSNCYFQAGSALYGFNNLYNQSPTTSATFINCTFEESVSAQMNFGGTGTLTMTNCRFRDPEADQVKLFGSGIATFTNCHFGPYSRSEGAGEDIHGDGFQNTGGTRTVTLTGCTFDHYWAGSNNQIPSGRWLYNRAISAGVSTPYYEGAISYFKSTGNTETTTFDSCFFLGMGTNGIQHKDNVGASCETIVQDCTFYLGCKNLKTGGAYGVWTDGGGNTWGETGLDGNGISRTVGDPITF